MVGAVDIKTRLTAPNLLRKILRGQKLSDYISCNNILFTGIHAIMLEFGFVGVDPVSRLWVNQFHDLLQKQSSMNTSVVYSLPQLLADDVNDSVVLRFQTLGRCVNVYGTLANGKSPAHKICLDILRFWPTIYSLRVGNDLYDENIVVELCKIVKDQLALPLLIDLCENSGLVLPPCFIRLPADLKLKILGSLSGDEIARMACVCKEIYHLSSSSEELWKVKFEKEFRNIKVPQQIFTWKEKFVYSYTRKTQQERTPLPPDYDGLRRLKILFQGQPSNPWRKDACQF